MMIHGNSPNRSGTGDEGARSMDWNLTNLSGTQHLVKVFLLKQKKTGDS